MQDAPKGRKKKSNLDESPYGLSDYLLLNVLGSGSFGKVYKAVCKETKKECAIKVLFKHLRIH